MDVRIRGRKAAGDLWEVRSRGAVAAVTVALAAICLRLQALEAPLVWGLVLLALIGVGQAVAPLGHERAAEAEVLRALGASDRALVACALLESGAMGAIAGLVGALLALASGQLPR